MPTTPWCQDGSKNAAAAPGASATASAAARACSSISPSIRRRSRFRRSSSSAQLAARAASSVTRHSMPRLMSASRPAALSRGPSTKPRSNAFACALSRPAARSSASSPGCACARAQALQALRDEDAVVGIQRHHVGHGAERDEVGERGEVGLGCILERAALSQLGAQREHHVEHHAHAGDRLGGEAAAGLVRVDDALGARQLRAGQVVVGDQRGDAERARALHALDARDAVVHRDEQVRAPLRRDVHELGREAVAELEAVGHQVLHVRAHLRSARTPTAQAVAPSAS